MRWKGNPSGWERVIERESECEREVLSSFLRCGVGWVYIGAGKVKGVTHSFYFFFFFLFFTFWKKPTNQITHYMMMRCTNFKVNLMIYKFGFIKRIIWIFLQTYFAVKQTESQLTLPQLKSVLVLHFLLDKSLTLRVTLLWVNSSTCEIIIYYVVESWFIWLSDYTFKIMKL